MTMKCLISGGFKVFNGMSVMVGDGWLMTTSDFTLTNSIDHIVKSRIQMGPDFILPESVKNIACVGLKINYLNYSHRIYSKLLQQREVQLVMLDPSGVYLQCKLIRPTKVALILILNH